MTRRFAATLIACLTLGLSAAFAQQADESASECTRIVEPEEGAQVPQGGILHVRADVHISGWVRTVTLEVDLQGVSSRRWEPYVFSWDTTRATLGKHKVKVKVVDLQGNESTCDPVTVEVVPRTWTLPPEPPGEPLSDGTWTRLIQRAEGVEADLQFRHDREGLIDNIEGQPAAGGDPLSGMADPRGPLLTGTYLGACAYRYATVRDPDARARAKQANEALHMLSSATGVGGLLSRWYRRTTEAQPDEDQPGLLRWRQNGPYRWLGDASPSDLAGVLYGQTLYFDLVADDEEKHLTAQDVRAVVNRLLEDKLIVTNADGLPVPEGDLSPGGLSEPYNAPLALGFFKIAHHMTGDAKFDEQYQSLLRDHEYHKKGIKPRDISAEEWSAYNDYAAMLMYCCLLKYETDKEIRDWYYKGMEAVFQSNAKAAEESALAKRPLFNIIYKRFSPEVDTEVQGVEWLLESRSPLGDSEWLLANWMGRYYQIIR